jgi:hypothetical protein
MMGKDERGHRYGCLLVLDTDPLGSVQQHQVHITKDART